MDWLLIILATVYMVKTTSTGFIPSEDQGFIAISLSMPAGASLESTTKRNERSRREIRQSAIKKSTERHFRF